MNESHTHDNTYWKSSEERTSESGVLEGMGNEFPSDYDEAASFDSPIKRRTFLGLAAATAAFATVGCRRPEQHIVPYVKKPEYLIPGVANHFATAFAYRNFASGLLVKTREGRPIKIEGNDLDPISGGKTMGLAQASLLSLYDPDRILRPTVNNSDSTPKNAIKRMADAIAEVSKAGKGIRILVDEHASPSLAKLYRELEETIANCKVVTMSPVGTTGEAEANREMLGIDGVLVPDLSKAEVIVGIDADFLGTDPAALYHIRNFSAKRKPSKENPSMSRYYAVEPNLSMSGQNADVRVRIKPGEIREFLLALLHELVIEQKQGSLDASLTAEIAKHKNPRFKMITSIAQDLISKPGVVLVGAHLDSDIHALGILANMVIGAYGYEKVFEPSRVLPYSQSKKSEVETLLAEAQRGDVGVILFSDVNTAYALPGGNVRALTSKVLYKFAFGLYADETSKVCSIFVPVNHYLESWGDTVSIDGSQSVVQPLIAPMNDGQLSLGDALLLLGQTLNPETFNKDVPSFYAYVQRRWESEVYPSIGGSSWQQFWEKALRTGTVATKSLMHSFAMNASRAMALMNRPALSGDFVCGILPHHSVLDSRYANLGWLQEMADPVTKLVWDNAAIIGWSTAKKYALEKGDIIKVKSKYGSVDLPVFIHPGIADDTIITHVGFGRTEGGRVCAGVGINVYPLLRAGADAIGYVAVTIEKTGETHELATTQDHHSLSGTALYGIDRSGIVKESDLDSFLTNPQSLFEGELPVYGSPTHADEPISIMKDYDYSSGHRWAMTIDSSACVGCNACVLACVAENNIPMVGKDEVMRGREMHWIRIDRYYKGHDANPQTLFQPMLCQHCENAPCENVCPVAATTHSSEGLNEMTYNRCVGTRYCSNNCPYKVRRFNYFDWHKEEREPMPMVYNPDVTVRMRGIMEKCTFCVQRINEAKYHAKNEGRDLVNDGEVVTACQQVCPADAIVFGNVNDPNSAVSKMRQSERGYLVLRDLNTRPSVTYLAKIRNTSGVKA